MLGQIAILVVVTVAVSYLLGCFNGALLISKYILHDDVRNHGSGNAGLTNFYRVFGGPLTAVVILCDMLKAVIAVLLGAWLLGDLLGWGVLGKYIAGVSCMLGHMYPCMFQFKGGKGALSGFAVVLMINWKLALIIIAIFAVAVAITRWVSLGSLLGGLTFIAGTIILYRNPAVIVFGTVIGVLVFWQHRSNIVRIFQGKESKFQLHKKKDTEEQK